MTPNDYEVLTDFILEKGFEKIDNRIEKINFVKKQDIYITSTALENSLLFANKNFLIFINKETNAGVYIQKGRFGSQAFMFSLKVQSMIDTLSWQFKRTERTKR